MKKIILLLFLLSQFSCRGQNGETEAKKEDVEPIKNKKTMKYFDIKRFETNQKNEEYLYLDSFGNQVREWRGKVKNIYYGRYVFLKNEFNVKFLYHFYSSGILKEEGKVFDGGGVRIGIWNFYDEKGVLTKSIDYDKPFDNYPLEKVLEYMKGRKAELLGMYTRIYRKIDEKGVPMWYISWDANQRTKEDCITIINIEINAQKGKIIKEYHSFFWEYNNPYDKMPEPIIIFDEAQQKSNTSQTFQGKTYTEEEWKAFEQEQWEKYQANRNKKGVIS